MRTINTDKRLKYLYWKQFEKPGTEYFMFLMRNPKPNTSGEAVFMLSERIKDLIHSLPLIGRYFFND